MSARLSTVFAILLAAGAASAQVSAPAPVPPPPAVANAVRLEVFLRGLKRPVFLASAPGDSTDRLFVVEQVGRIRLVRRGKLVARSFLDISDRVSRGEEQGLLGLAFHPNFAQNRRLFVNYTDLEGHTRVFEFRADPRDPDRSDPSSGRLLLTIEQPFANHNGGHLEFGADGKLYIGTGDGGAANDPKRHGQNRKTLLGKMLVFDVDTRATPTIAAIGLRNPWRYHFDRATQDLYIADVGQNLWEWIHVVPAGQLTAKNFGWNILEGTRCFQKKSCNKEGLTLPVVEYSHQEGCSITGGVVYRGQALPALRGHYFYADYCTALLRSFRWSAGRVTEHWDWKAALDSDFKLAQISSFAVDRAGEVYVLSLGGVIYRLVPNT